MKKIALAVTALSMMLTGAASAADLAARPYAKAPPPVMAPIYNWTGFYIGLNGGGGWSDKCWDIYNNLGAIIAPPFREGCNTASGATVGGQVGYRWQAANWVFGLEAQGNWADFTGSHTSLFFGPGAVNRTRVDAFGLFTGQVGYSWNNVLLYVKGGAAVTSDRYDGLFNGVVIDTAQETRWGGAVGVGAEFGFTPNWSLGLEYNHLFLGDRDVSFNFVNGAGFARGVSIRQDVDVVTARINYRFGGPIVARY